MVWAQFVEINYINKAVLVQINIWLLFGWKKLYSPINYCVTNLAIKKGLFILSFARTRLLLRPVAIGYGVVATA